MKNTARILLPSALAFTVFLFINCTNSNTNGFNQVLGKEWKVISIDEKYLNADDLENDLPIITFRENNRLSGFTSCNTFNGTYKLDSTNITLDPGAMTKMMCYGDVELNFLAALKTVNAYKLNKTGLELLNGNKIVMRLLPE